MTLLITFAILNLVGVFLAARYAAVAHDVADDTYEAVSDMREELAGMAADYDNSDQLTLECDALHAKADANHAALVSKLDGLSGALPKPRKRRARIGEQVVQ